MIKRFVRRARSLKSATMLRASAILTIVALASMVWSLVDPTPLPVMLAMSFGQLLGTLAFALYGIAILRDLRAQNRETREKREAAEADAPATPGDPV